jgi:hypothetical protein
MVSFYVDYRWKKDVHKKASILNKFYCDLIVLYLFSPQGTTNATKK